ncbi:hypothetical protein V6N13_053283 [Hibiscus sabdariffa]|uniref:Uncharacterized protein n=1 Tax=Hibiscus sabdariffa TaxID=183260 RepID=A0ABR2Q6S7_9ROSI
MPTSHNQTVDHKRLVLIHSIIFGNKFDVGEVIAKELSEVCKNDKGILAFPCLILALCRRHGVPTYKNDKYTDFRPGWDRKHYLKKIDVADATPIQVAIPTPAQYEHTKALAPAANPENLAGSEQTTPPAEPQGSPSAASAEHGSFAAALTPPAPQADLKQSPAHSVEVPPLYIMQLRNQIQRIEARHIEFITETKRKYITPPMRSLMPLTGIRHSRLNSHHLPLPQHLDHRLTLLNPLEHGNVKPQLPDSYGKTPPELTTDPPATTDPPTQASPAKRQRRYHLVLSDSDDDGSDEPTSSKSLAF